MMTKEQRRERDGALALKARAGDAPSRAELVAHYDGLAWSVARRYWHPTMSAEDLAQEARIGLLDAVDRWDPSRGSFFAAAETWCRCRVAHAVRKSIRLSSAAPEARSDRDPAELADARLEREDESDVRKQMVRAALGRLDERSRKLLELRYFSADEVSLKEVGAAVGVCPSRAQQLHAEALDALAAELGSLVCAAA